MILELDQINKHNQKLVGGKAYSLAKMAREGIAVPQGICISIDAYEQFVRCPPEKLRPPCRTGTYVHLLATSNSDILGQ